MEQKCVPEALIIKLMKTAQYSKVIWFETSSTRYRRNSSRIDMIMVWHYYCADSLSLLYTLRSSVHYCNTNCKMRQFLQKHPAPWTLAYTYNLILSPSKLWPFHIDIDIGKYSSTSQTTIHNSILVKDYEAIVRGNLAARPMSK